MSKNYYIKWKNKRWILYKWYKWEHLQPIMLRCVVQDTLIHVALMTQHGLCFLFYSFKHHELLRFSDQFVVLSILIFSNHWNYYN